LKSGGFLLHKETNMKIFDLTTQVTSDPKITPLPQLAGLPVEKFDFSLLPSSLRKWGEDIQHRLQCPADYVGVAIMISLAAAVGNKVMIQPKANDHSWKVVPNLWGLLIGSPSSMKSPAMDSALRHISKMEGVLRDFKVTNSKGTSFSKRIMVRDTTIEQLQVIQSENPTGILYVQDEISALFRKFEQPSNNDRPYLLEAFNGNSSYSVDRVTRGSVFIEKNTLSLIGTIQPDVLQDIFMSKGSSNDGFMQRLQLAVWPDPVKQEYIDEPPNEDADLIACDIFIELYELKDNVLCFCPKAQKVFTNWYKDSIRIIDELNKDEAQHNLVNHITKYRKMVPAVALLIELAEDPDAKEVIEESIVTAIRWANYLITHAKRIYGIQDKDTLIAQSIIEKRDKLVKSFSPSEIVQKSWRGLNDTENVKRGISVLVKNNYLIKLISSTNKNGGRPSDRYRWSSQLK
jgi:hypothetical protein